MANTNVSGLVAAVALPRPALVPQWMAQLHVPAVGIGLVSANRTARIKVYGELSKGIPAPQNTVWGSRELGDAVGLLLNENSEERSTLHLVNLFTKLAMPDTAFGDPIGVLSRMARPHNKRDGIYVFKPHDTEKHLFTTVGDFCKLLTYINKSEIVTTDWPTDWKQLADQERIIHRAAGNGASHTILLLPQQKQALVIFTNSDGGDKVEEHILNAMGIDIL